jgi:hypothetical protein
LHTSISQEENCPYNAPTRGLSSGHHVQEAVEVLQTAFG